MREGAIYHASRYQIWSVQCASRGMTVTYLDNRGSRLIIDFPGARYLPESETYLVRHFRLISREEPN